MRAANPPEVSRHHRTIFWDDHLDRDIYWRGAQFSSYQALENKSQDFESSCRMQDLTSSRYFASNKLLSAHPSAWELWTFSPYPSAVALIYSKNIHEILALNFWWFGKWIAIVKFGHFSGWFWMNDMREHFKARDWCQLFVLFKDILLCLAFLISKQFRFLTFIMMAIMILAFNVISRKRLCTTFNFSSSRRLLGKFFSFHKLLLDFHTYLMSIGIYLMLHYASIKDFIELR